VCSHCALVKCQMVLTSDTMSMTFIISIYIRLQTFGTSFVRIVGGLALAQAIPSIVQFSSVQFSPWSLYWAKGTCWGDLVPAGGDVRHGAAGALETAKVTSLSDERWAWAVEFVSIQWQWAVLTGQVADVTDVTSQACHQSSMSSTSSVIGSWKQNIMDNEVIVTQNMSSLAQPSEPFKLSQWHGDFTSWAGCIIWSVVFPPVSQYCPKASRLKYVQFITYRSGECPTLTSM